MKNFMILFTVIAFAVLASCSRLDNDRWYDKPGDDYSDADNEAQNDAEPTDTGDTDSANTGDSGNTDSADSADTSDVTDSGEPVDTAPDEGDTTPDEGDTKPDDDGDSTPDTGDNEPDDDIDEPDTGDNEPDDDIDEPDTGDNEPDDDIDEPDTGETPEECTQITLTNNINIEGDGGIDHPDNSVFYTDYTPNTGSSEKADTFYVKFVGLTSFEGEFKLEGKNMNNKEGLLIYVKEDGGTTIYFQRSGTVNVKDDYDDGWLGLNGSATISATLTDVVLEQVTIDESSNESSPVNGGACLKVSNTTLKYDEEIEGWL